MLSQIFKVIPSPQRGRRETFCDSINGWINRKGQVIIAGKTWETNKK